MEAYAAVLTELSATRQVPEVADFQAYAGTPRRSLQRLVRQYELRQLPSRGHQVNLAAARALAQSHEIALEVRPALEAMRAPRAKVKVVEVLGPP